MAVLIATVVAAVSSHAECKKTFTVPMIERAINVAYGDDHVVKDSDKRNLGRYIRCSRKPGVRAAMHRYWNQAWRAQWNRLHPPMVTQLASWYYDGGNTACGFHATYGVANKTLPCGTKVLFTYHGRSAWAVVQDRGPYAGGRVWDLNQGLAGALGFSGVDYVQASVAG